MIAKIYFCVGTLNFKSDNIPNAFAFPSRIFGADEEAQAIREYERLAKRNFDMYESFQYAYCVKMVGETKSIVRGEDWMLGYI